MYELIIDDEIEEFADMGSFNHGYVQARLTVLFDRVSQYTPINELSLDVSGINLSQFDIKSKEEVKPDIALYPKRGLSRPTDILRMIEMPLLAVEILSPKQGTYDILQKFKVYFELGVKSCWLVEPAINTVTVYSSINHWKTFSDAEVIDEIVDIRLMIEEIFT